MFELDAIKLQVDTSQLDNAVKQIDALKKAAEQIGKETNRSVQQPKQDSHVKSYTKSIEEQAKSVDKLDKLYSKLDQTILDLANEFTKGESSILRYARSLGATKDQMQEVEARLTKLRPLVKDPFDSAIGSVRRISQEFNELQNRQDLLSKGFHLSSKELREYSRIALEVEAKMQAAGKDTKGTDLQVFKAKVAEEQSKYLEIQQAVSSAKVRESSITTTSGRVYKQQDYNQQYLAYQSYEIKKVKARQKAEEDIFASLEREKDRMNKQVASMASTNVNATKIQFLQQQESKYMDRLKAKGVDVGDLSIERRKQLSEYLTASDKMWEANNRVGKSSREMAFAMRQVPMQITDIVTSLAAGQPPMQVFLQQGGQLKDLFGGVKEAAVALGKGLKDALISSFAMLSSPIGLSITALGIFGASAYSAANTSKTLADSLVLMGNNAKISKEELLGVSNFIGNDLGVRTLKAGQAFIELSKTVDLPKSELSKLTNTLVEFEKYGGQSVDKTASKISALKDDPLKAMYDLNKEVGFLTPEIVKNTNSFLEQGNTAKASALLIDEYRKALEQMTSSLKSNRGPIDELLDSMSERFNRVANSLASFTMKFKELDSLTWQGMAVKLLSGESPLPNAPNQTNSVSQRTSTGKVTPLGGKSVTPADTQRVLRENFEAFNPRKNRDWAAIVVKAQEDQISGLRSLDETQKYLSAKAEEIFGKADKPKTKVDNKESEKKRLEDLTTTYKEEYAKQINLNTSYTKDLEDLNKIRNKLSTEEYAAAKRKIELGGDASAVKGIEEQYAVILNQGKQVNRDYADQLRYIKEARLSESERAKALQDLENKQPYAVQAKFLENINSQFKEHVDLQILQIENQNKNLAISEKDRLIQDAILKVEQQRLQLTNDINNRSDLSEGQKSLAISNLNTEATSDKERVKNAVSSMYDQTNSFTAGWNKAFNSYTDAAKNAATMGESFFSKMADGMTDSILQFVKTGKLSFSDFATSIISDLLRIQIKQQVVGLMGNSTGGLGGLFNSAFGNFSAANKYGTNLGSQQTSMLAAQDLAFQANGGAWFNGIQKFANGGVFTNSIVTNPTLFGGKFANGGKFGLMGEAGPEAIIPLSRDSSGRLGVSMHNSNSSGVSVVINNTGTQTTVTNQTEVTDSRGNRRIELTLADAVSSEQARHGSAMYNSTKNTFGLKPTLVGR